MTSEFAIAVHALVYLHHKNAVLSSEELAENICTNSARVRKVMAKLKKKDLIGTKEGIKGGYHMSLDASEITLGDICEALQVDIVKAAWRSGSMDMDCMIASGMAGSWMGFMRNWTKYARSAWKGLRSRMWKRK